MRIEEYVRELKGDGFLVVGSSCDWNSHDSSKCEPIKMSRTHSTAGNPYGIDVEAMIQLAESDLFWDENMKKLAPEFAENYAEIMRGNRPDWQLGAFRVFYGDIQLHYGDRKTGETGSLYIVGAERLCLTFEAPRMRSGFIPTYKVHIECHEDGWSDTRVEEDLGYLRRELVFELKNPDKKASILHNDNQILRVFEYAGM